MRLRYTSSTTSWSPFSRWRRLLYRIYRYHQLSSFFKMNEQYNCRDRRPRRSVYTNDINILHGWPLFCGRRNASPTVMGEVCDVICRIIVGRGFTPAVCTNNTNILHGITVVFAAGAPRHSPAALVVFGCRYFIKKQNALLPSISALGKNAFYTTNFGKNSQYGKCVLFWVVRFRCIILNSPHCLLCIYYT